MLSLIAISYYGSADLPGLLVSLQKQTSPEWHLWIVDNSESDNEYHSIRALVDEEVRVSVLRPPSNLGYFGAAQWALAEAAIEGDWVAVCNTDLVLASMDFVARLSTVDDDGIGVIAPSVISTRTGRDQNPHLLLRPSVKSMRRRWQMLSHPVLAQSSIILSAAKSALRHQSEGLTSSSAVYAGHGSFMLFSRRYFEMGGSFRHPVFLFAEEITVAETCLDMGLKVIYDPIFKIEHVEHGQMGLLRSRQILAYSGQASRYAYELIKSAPRGQ